MFYQWIKYNFTILIYKITNRKHESDLHKYVFRNFQSYCQKIDEWKDPYDCVDYDKIDEIVERRISSKTPNEKPSLKEQYAILRSKLDSTIEKS